MVIKLNFLSITRPGNLFNISKNKNAKYYFITFLLPRSCNFNCSFCSVSKKKRKNVNFQIIKKILQKANEYNIQQILLSGGGEPSIFFPEIIKIIKLARKMNIQTILQTNCSFILNKKLTNPIKRLKEAGLSSLKISVDYDHLKFVPYKKIAKVIKQALEMGIGVSIRVVNRTQTINQNIYYLKKISHFLKGKLIPLLPNLFMSSYSLIILKNKKLVPVLMFPVVPSKVNCKLIEATPIKHTDLAFKFCNSHITRYSLYMDIEKNMILPCTGFNFINMPATRYSLGKISEDGIIFKKQTKMLQKIYCNKFTFLWTYLKVCKNRKLKEEFFKNNFFSECEFCDWILRHRDKINEIKDPSLSEMFSFLLLNINKFLSNYFSYFWEEFVYFFASFLAQTKILLNKI